MKECPFVSAGKVIHSMVAHLDAVTSLAVDPNGIYLMSGSECHSKLLSVEHISESGWADV